MIMEEFESLTGYKPCKYQAETYETLAKGKSIIHRAPTGRGKSEAVFVLFEKEKCYNLYVVLSRALRLADRKVTQHEFI